jgi:hypothetical protein
MKRLLILTAVVMLAAGTLGCEATRSWCGCGRRNECATVYAPAPACNSCDSGGIYDNSYLAPPSVDMMTPGPVTE